MTWNLPSPVMQERASAFARELNVPPAFAAALLARGAKTREAASRFCRPALEALHDPLTLPDMPQAVERIVRAVKEGETVGIFGDYDTDGLSGTALLAQALRDLGARADPYVPDRLAEGYGLSSRGLDALAKAGASVVISSDCGITAGAEATYATGRGMDLIITDHHEPDGPLPEALAVIDPKRPDTAYPFRELAGVGVAFKLVQTVYERLGHPPEAAFRFLDFVALGTAADIVPMVDENRILVRHGLARLGQTPHVGLQALVESVDPAVERLQTRHVVFTLAPRLNAAGRLGSARRALRMLLTDSATQARNTARMLEAENRRRRELDEATLAEALGLMADGGYRDGDSAIVLWRAGWHPGVIGIVASRLVDRFHLPTIVIAMEGDSGRGSGRSVPGFHLHAALHAVADHLARFGGHEMACGLEVRAEAALAFKAAFLEEAAQKLAPAMRRRTLEVDAVVVAEELNAELGRLQRHLEPFGPQNRRPVYAVLDAQLVGEPRIVGRDHSRLRLRAGDGALEAIAFRTGERLLAALREHRRLDVAGTLTEDRWQQRRRWQLEIKDFRPADG